MSYKITSIQSNLFLIKTTFIKWVLLFLVCMTTLNSVFAQNADCVILMDAIKGAYSGDCKNGKANGIGKAAGIDSYEGQFVEGYPEGKGMYIWKDGHYYIGQLKKGKLNGTGEMYYESANGDDSLIIGYWEKDKYKGLYEKPYIIHSSTTKILEISCKQRNKKGKTITIETYRVSSEGTIYRKSGVVLPFVKNIEITEGGYKDSQSINLANTASTILLEAIFPFRATIYFTDGEFFEISLLEKADYDISVKCL